MALDTFVAIEERASSTSMCGFNLDKCKFGGTWRCCIAETALVEHVEPNGCRKLGRTMLYPKNG